jgi:hypothetical protein
MKAPPQGTVAPKAPPFRSRDRSGGGLMGNAAGRLSIVNFDKKIFYSGT